MKVCWKKEKLTDKLDYKSNKQTKIAHECNRQLRLLKSERLETNRSLSMKPKNYLKNKSNCLKATYTSKKIRP